MPFTFFYLKTGVLSVIYIYKSFNQISLARRTARFSNKLSRAGARGKLLQEGVLPVKQILLVEDDPEISDLVKEHLENEGYRVLTAADGEEAARLFANGGMDLVLLDLMLPKMNGITLLKQIRVHSSVPILILSAKGSDLDKALGLGFGADDYIAKPFSLIELTARVQAAIRRATDYTVADAKEERVLQRGGIRLDVDAFMAYKNGQAVKLTAKEFQLLHVFMENPKRVFTKEQLYQQIWNEPYLGEENVINVHIRRLREKIETNPSKPEIIETVWGIGYKLGAPQ
jgi:DNA-binding response OmpR family regulator